MAGLLSHRGPDDHGVAVIGQVGLAHTRLSILDCSDAGHQPMVQRSGSWWVSYNGEIFNHRQVRARLVDAPYRSTGDTETLLELLHQRGIEGVRECNGLFAFAALDVHQRRLHLVRDRFGVKPLYVATVPGGFAFASELRVLFEAGVPRRTRIDVLLQAVAGWANGPHTPVEGVRRVLPGRILTIDLTDMSCRDETWFAPTDLVDAAYARELADLTGDGAAEQLENRLRESVRLRLLSDVPVGTMCSGGVDSSVVTALATAEQPSLRAYNVSVTDDPAVDEGPFAASVARHLGIELRTYRMTAADWRAGLVRTVRHIEYPLTHESSVPMAALAQLARADGVKVLLSGEGADEILGGYEHLHARAHRDFDGRQRRLESLVRSAYRSAQWRGLLRDPRPDPLPGPQVVADYERAVVTRALRAYRHHRGARQRLEAHLLADLSLYLPHLLNRQDKSTMLASVETRIPFLDPDVVRFAVNLPLELRIEPRRKAPLRAISDRLLPAEISTRPKLGFGFDVGRYLAPAARPEFLRDGMLRHEMQIDRDHWAEAVAGIAGQGWLTMWTAEIWCRSVLAGQPDEQVEEALWSGQAAGV
jgi:asparagine synthase (glutamine-hydrolysing)